MGDGSIPGAGAGGRGPLSDAAPVMISGWIILDKPVGLGSTQAVAAVKRKLEYDLQYIENMSLSQEIKLLFATFAKFRDEGAR